MQSLAIAPKMTMHADVSTDIVDNYMTTSSIYAYRITSRHIQSGNRKIAQSFRHNSFANVCSRITRFLPKCSEING